ncbi:MAG: hypothetical protein Q8O55_11310 [Dehalococcoidales bacterium]|nr:hypothetical protein [Dehalococcoidales bacterium]
MKEGKDRINGSGHHWMIVHHVQYISRGTCKCGAVSFFANSISKEAIELAGQYNKSEGKEGRGHMVTTEAIKSETPEVEKENSDPSPVPPRPKGKRQLGQYFEDNKGGILQDYQSLKLKEFFAKWHMTSATWTKLKRGWELLGKSPRKSAAQSGIPRPRKHKGSPSIEAVNRALKERGANHLPAFPEFNEQWSDYVKINWFETYQALKELEVKQ